MHLVGFAVEIILRCTAGPMDVKFVIIYSGHYSCKLLHNQQMYIKRLKIVSVQNCCMFQRQGAIFSEPQLVFVQVLNEIFSARQPRQM